MFFLQLKTTIKLLHLLEEINSNMMSQYTPDDNMKLLWHHIKDDLKTVINLIHIMAILVYGTLMVVVVD